jgi:hypothetical protein
MIDSQTQVRWLTVAVALVVLVIGPVLAGNAFAEPRSTSFAVYDGRGWDEATLASQKRTVGQDHAIFLVLPHGDVKPAAACPPLEPNAVEMPMPATPHMSAALAVLEANCSDLRTSSEPDIDPPRYSATLTRRPFSWPYAFGTVVLLLIGTLLAVAVLAGRQPRRPVAVVRDPAPAPPYRPPVPVVRDAAPAPLPRPMALPVLALADLPGAREVIREHGATAKARSHIDGAGGYVALGDVLMWATPVAGGVAFPDDDVHVTVPVTPTMDGGPRP